jgi:hypothetical protein
MEKPLGITVSTLLMSLVLVVGIIMLFASPLHPAPTRTLSPEMIVKFTHIFGLAFTVLVAVCVYFYWTGQDWARWLVMIDSVLKFFQIFHISKAFHTAPANGVLTLCEGILALFLLWYLNTAAIRTWFVARKTEPAAVAS